MKKIKQEKTQDKKISDIHINLYNTKNVVDSQKNISNQINCGPFTKTLKTFFRGMNFMRVEPAGDNLAV